MAHTADVRSLKWWKDEIAANPMMLPFIGLHLMALGVFWTGVTPTAVVLCVVMYVVRVFGITGGFHRYFAHKTYQTSRAWQFVMAWLGMMSLQSGVLWWAVKHREHHRDSDTEADAHSPRHYGFWGAHMGWIFSDRANVDYSMIKDFTKYPELVWLNKYDTVPGVVAAWTCYFIGGLPGLFFGFIFSTILVYHATFLINSLAHVFGKQRYLTGDDSRNNWLLGIIAMGEGWHNNHHFYPGSARNGFFWWEIDMTYYGLRMLEKLGLVWDLRVPPKSVLTGEKAPSSAIVDKVAAHIASGVNVEAIAERIRQRWEQQGKRIEEVRGELRQRAQQMKADAEAYLAEFEFPEVPTADELREKARKKFANTPSLEEAVTRAQGMIRDSLSTQLMNEPSPVVVRG